MGHFLSSNRFLYQGDPPAERHARHRRLPRHLRVQLAGPSRLRRGPREAPGGRTPKEPGGDARVAEEHLPPHPLRARRVAERDRAGRLRGPRHAREGLRRSPIHGAPSRIPGENHCKGKTVPRQAHRQGSRPRRAAGMEDPPSSAARCVDAGDPRAGPPHGRTDRPPLADRRRTTRNDVDRRAPGDERRPRPFVVAEVTRRGLQVRNSARFPAHLGPNRLPAVRFAYSIDWFVTNTMPSPNNSEGRSRRRARKLIRRADRNAGSRNQIPTRIRWKSRSVVNMSPDSMGARARRLERSFPLVLTGGSVRTMTSSMRLSATHATVPMLWTVPPERGLPAVLATVTRFLLCRCVHLSALLT